MERRNQRANRLLAIVASVGILGIFGAVIAGAAMSQDDGRPDAAPTPTEFTTQSTATTDHQPTTTTTATVATPTTLATLGTLPPGSHPSQPLPVIVPGPTPPTTHAVTPTTTPRSCIPRPARYGAKDIDVTIHLDQTRVQRGTVIGATVTFSNPHDQPALISMEYGYGYFTVVAADPDPEWARVPLSARPDIRHWAICVDTWYYVMPPNSSVTASGTLETSFFPPGDYPIETAIARDEPVEDFGGPGATFTVLPAPPTTTTPPTTN